MLSTTNTKTEPKPHPQQQQQSSQLQNNIVGVKGVRLKHFERALVKLLSRIVDPPRYLPLHCLLAPSLPQGLKNLPAAARAHGTLPGQISNLEKATRKDGQIQSLLTCILALLPPPNHDTTTTQKETMKTTIVDFGGGSGHLSIPLALLLPHCNIICLDLKQKSLDLLHEKARHCIKESTSTKKEEEIAKPKNNNKKQSKLQPTSISNLWTYSGDIESYTEPFQLGVALHVCGEATDVVLRKCAHNKAHLVVAPCCVGKLNRQRKDPYIYQASAQNSHTISYPQSTLFQQCLDCSCGSSIATIPQPVKHSTKNNNQHHNKKLLADDWDALAKAADYNHELDMNDRRNAARRTAKGLLELDRQLFLQQEHFAYQTVLTRMDPLSASPKNDILLGYYCGDDDTDKNNNNNNQRHVLSTLFSSDHLFQEDQVIRWTKEHLLSSPDDTTTTTTTSLYQNNELKSSDDKDTTDKSVTPGTDTLPQNNSNNNSSGSKTKQQQQQQTDSVDWNWQEEQDIRQQITTYFDLSMEGKAPIMNTPVGDTANDTTTTPITTPSSSSNQEPALPNNNNNTTLVFPTRMGNRKRKLVHYVAEQMGLAHWCIGKKNAEKTVAVRKKYTMRSSSSQGL